MKTSTVNKISMVLAIICFYFGLTWLFPVSHISFSPVITYQAEEKHAKQFKELAESLKTNNNADQVVAEGLGEAWGEQSSPIAMNAKSFNYIEKQLKAAQKATDNATVKKDIEAALRDLHVVQERNWKTRYTLQDYITNVHEHVIDAMKHYDESL